MAITDWPAEERPREKLLARGAQALSDAELLAIFLRTGLPGVSAVDLARQLLTDFGGLRPLLQADRTAFCTGKGLGDAKFVQLQAVLEMGRRHLAESLKRSDALTSPQAVRDYLAAQLRHRTREVFCCLFLDSQHRVIAYEELFEGTLNAASVYPREVVQAALAKGAA
ncbi:RadC family protein, partial [Microbulbifer sp.]|uniref:RadC family protein n=1 Tax=Microbulbifer sp. TaxID=1908541 RepID=UPI002F9453CC